MDQETCETKYEVQNNEQELIKKRKHDGIEKLEQEYINDEQLEQEYIAMKKIKYDSDDEQLEQKYIAMKKRKCSEYILNKLTQYV